MKKRTITGALVGAALTAAAAFGLYETQQGTDSYGGLTLAEAQGMKAEGHEVYVQALSASTSHGLVIPGDRIPSLENARAAGLAIAGYALIDCDYDGRSDMDYTRAGIPDDIWAELLFVAVDVEESCDKYAAVLGALDRLNELGIGARVIYTSYNSWVSYLGNPPKPRDTLLWDAYWNNNPAINYASHPYGGWTEDEVIGKQYQGGDVNGKPTMVAGQNVDKNTFVLGKLPARSCPAPADPSTGLAWDACYRSATFSGRWMNDAGWYCGFVASVCVWYRPDGTPEWGECDARYGHCWNLQADNGRGAWSGPLFYPELNTWSVPPIASAN